MSETREAKEEAREAKEETREAKSKCDKIARDLHAATLEGQAWKQATAEAKAAVRPTSTQSFAYLTDAAL